MNETAQQESSNFIECPAAGESVVRLAIIAAMLIGLGAWCGYDHFIKGKYPYPDPYSLNPYLKYVFNHYGPMVLIPAGLVFVVLAAAAARRRLLADDEGIGYRGKPKYAWGEITAVDASRLKTKSILVLKMGADKKLVLDSYKLQGFKELVAFVEKRLPPNVSIGQ